MQIKNHLTLVLAALTMLMLGCTKESKDSSTAQLEVDIPKLPVDAVMVKKEPIIQEELLVGTILPNKEVSITGELSKKVTKIYFNEGSFVKQGQLLYKLDDSDLVAKHKQIKAEIDLAKLNEDRLSELLKSHSIRQEEYDIAFTKLQSLLASEDLVKSEIEKTSIKAPFSGYLGITKVHLGALVTPGMELVKLQDQANVRIQFAVPEKSIRSVIKGQQIAFNISDHGKTYAAQITASEPGLDYNNRSIMVHALVENPDGIFKPGMSAKVYLKRIENYTGVVLPTEALMPGENGYSVFSVKKGNAKIISVTVAERNERQAIITSGVNHGDTIMVSNMLRAGDGVPVELVTLN